jgi:DNA polymerase III subunit epsilon
MNALISDFPPLAFVDIETTGGNAARDRITEVAVITLQDGQLFEWSRLINPGVFIPKNIQILTGIDHNLIENEPAFSEVAREIYEQLEGKIFIAHNARFDYGFLKASFKRCDLDFRAKVLCTVKLSRLLFPEQPRHNLDTIIAAHQLTVSSRHRALGDAQVLEQFWKVCLSQFGVSRLQESVKALTAHPSLPPKIDQKLIDSIPDSPGVYLFYAENRVPIYIGKSNTLKTRVLGHFSSALSVRKEMKLSMQVADIDWIETAGEIGALLLESRLIKEKLPSLNIKLRRSKDLCAWRFMPNDGNVITPQLVRHDDLQPGIQEHLYGLFYSRNEAMKTLQSIAKKNELCEGLLGLEKLVPGKSCFGFQVKQCRGACVGVESLESYHLRLMIALKKFKVSVWPFKTPIGIREGNELHLIDHWCYLGTAINEDEVFELLSAGKPEFDLDIYKIIKKFLKIIDKNHIVQLSRPISHDEYHD